MATTHTGIPGLLSRALSLDQLDRLELDLAHSILNDPQAIMSWSGGGITVKRKGREAIAQLAEDIQSARAILDPREFGQTEVPSYTTVKFS